MSRSPYIDNVVLTNKHSGKRKHKVQAFVIHHMAAKWTGKRCAEYFRDTPSRQASANYCIGYDGDVALNVEEENRAWTSSSEWADQRAITYELANSKTGDPWEVSDVTIDKLIVMLAEQHKRYGLEKATYTGDTTGTLWRHDWFVKTNCPGPYLGGKFEYIAQEVNKILSVEKPIVAGAQVVAKKPVIAKPTVKPVVKEGGILNMNGTFVAKEQILVRNSPFVGAKHIATYYPGEQLKYDRAHFVNNYVWLEYKRGNGGKGFIPIAPLGEVWGQLK
ncbi:N-acetylmuramoyl-L-alanine amidase [Jeotgalibaca sp. A127]|uniref:N-acetylmuramoyl-L-alanine amidase n=1 Tax=Jeotgalibaca sp. A127 TaxID=3457324 RepID=UPI003FCF7793